MIKMILQGMIVGIANIIPGVSGGTMMVAMGLYDKLIHSITHLKSEFKSSMKLLLPIFFGAALAIVILSRLFEFLLQNYPIPTNFAFCGLIVGSLPFILKKVKGSEVLLIIQGLLQVLVQLEEYLIPADQICLDWNYIYLDPVSCYPSFCCLPAAEKKLEQGIRELLEELLPRLDHQEQTGVSVVYELYQYAIQDTFLVMGLQSVLERRLMEERKTTETELQACQEKKSREHQETSYFGDNRQAVLEDFFSSEEEEGENGRVSPVLVGMVLGIIGVLLYALAGYAVLEYVPQYLGTWAASGVMAILIVLIWQVVVRKRKKEERQIEEQFAIYQGTSEEAPRHSKTDIREWEEKDKELEAEEITWEKRIPWGGDTYTQILSNGGEQGGLILKELHPVSGRQFRIEKATRLTIIGQLKEQADLVLPSTAVSRVHASIEQRAGNWYLKDMNSRNGTWVNEQELYGEEEQELINGDQIRFADLIYQVKI